MSNESINIIFEKFLQYIKESKLELYPAQEEAILEIFSGKNVILNTPTGSGKSLVAIALHFYSIGLRKKSVYTCPIKALVNEKFISLCKIFNPNQVGMITGDATVNPDAPILCCTAEILAMNALRIGSNIPFADVIMDEFHYYSDRDRGVSWQIPLLTLSKTRFLLMSATLGEMTFFEKALTQLNGLPTKIIQSNHRPVPLEFEYSEIPLQDMISKLIKMNQVPIYLVHFTQRECAQQAQNLMSLDFCSKEEKKIIHQFLEGVSFNTPYGQEIQRFIKHGIGIHHAGLLPKYRLLIEKIAQQGILKIIIGTDTLGVGVNIPIKTVLFTKLCKFDGKKMAILSIRDFQQISGRAGRRGFDTEGYVVVQAPEYVIENIRLDQKILKDSKKAKKLIKKKPPEKGFINWNRETFDSLCKSEPEKLTSSFKISYSMLLHVLSRSDGTRAIRQLIRDCHEPFAVKKQLIKTGFQLIRALIDRKIIELNPIRINVDLQQDFSLNQSLSLYLLDAITVLNQLDPQYPLDLLTVVESILDDPEIILKKQLDKIKQEKLDELKIQGIDYEERMNELEKLEYPKPNREFIYNTFNIFSSMHPWIGEENIRPKSIAREIYENSHTFNEYIREYQLQKSEGILLRYLSDSYKVLTQSVPDNFKTDEVQAIIQYLRLMVRETDSSLIDEWEKIKIGHTRSVHKEDVEQNQKSTLNNLNVLKIAIRNEVFKIVKALSKKEYGTVLSLISNQNFTSDPSWTQNEMEKIMSDYYSSGHSKIVIDSKARSPKYITIDASTKNEEDWLVQHILTDPEEQNDWCIELIFHLKESQEKSKMIFSLISIKSL